MSSVARMERSGIQERRQHLPPHFALLNAGCFFSHKENPAEIAGPGWRGLLRRLANGAGCASGYTL